MKPNASAPRCRRSGFALLITITLVAFLVLLLVSFAAFTRVETQVASNSRQLAQARQNALMAMNVALGQLQLMMGPDARVSAPASQAGDGIAAYATDDVDNNPNWVGVYRQNPVASTPRDPQLLAWLVSGNQGLSVNASSANTPAVVPAAAVTTSNGPLSKLVTPQTPGLRIGNRDAVLLVGPASTIETPVNVAPDSVVERFVVAPVEPITVAAGTVPGIDPTIPATVGHFAYWVGDEGVKANVSLVDPWETPDAATLNVTVPPTTTAQAAVYRFINAQRMGIESVDAAAANTRLDGAYPASDAVFKDALPRVLFLSQLPFANEDTAGRAALALAQKARFHDLTASSSSLLIDVANGGFKRDLTAWIATNTPNPSGSADASAAFIAPGAGSTFGLPKWEMIRDYATTFNTGAAVPPRLQTDSLQGIYPVITYARMGFGLSAANTTPSVPPANGGRYKYHLMPVIALWNPYNVPIQASTNDSNSYEFCFRYTHDIPNTDVSLKIIAYGPYHALEKFNLSRISMEDASGAAGYPGNVREYGTGPEQQFWRFRVRLSRDLGPGESRLFTIDDSVDGSQYVSGVSVLSDSVVDLRNSVHIPSGTGTAVVGGNTVELPVATTSVFLNTEPGVPAGRNYFARMQVRLTKPVPSGILSTSAINDYIVQNSYQAIVGHGSRWGPDTVPGISIPTEMDRDELPFCSQNFELTMAALDTQAKVHSYLRPATGKPRWLATLNPQAALTLRKPFTEPAGNPQGNFYYGATPSYLHREYIKNTDLGYQSYTHATWRAPDADAMSNVSAGLQVSISATGGAAQKLVLREFQPAGTPLFSLGQLQHVNASTLNLNPAYAIGNSLANLYVPRDADNLAVGPDTYGQNASIELETGFPQNSKFARIYDLSHVLNAALWDGYFFSTVPPDLTAAQAGSAAFRLANARHRFHWNTSADAGNSTEFAELKDTATAAAHLALNGGFNINSTSVQAWRALLASHNGVATDPADATGRTKTPFSRFTTPVTGAEPNATWLGYRILSDAQIDALATAIVAEVRARGPFLTLADFVNRRLSTNATGFKGPLQAAIDATTGAGSVNGVAPFTDSTLRIQLNAGDTTNPTATSPYPFDIANGSADAETYVGGTDNTQPSASRATFAPGHLTQADLLTSLGSALTPRSDTFRIRAYGDIANPVTGTVEGRAWCEVIVQRQHDYVDAVANASTVAPGSATTLNQNFGRRFKIVSFRWLSSNDI